MSERTIGPFKLGRQLGVGGMGIVYEGIYQETGKRVAVKILAPGLIQDKKLLKRFDREVEILKRLRHPNIVRYFGGGRDGTQRYYAMEYIDGGSLQQVLDRRGRLTWDQAIHVGRQVSSALEHSHNAGIIHRDLKPANLFLSRKGRLKLGDFGIARDTEATALTAAGKTLGTYAYMAPEQIQAGPPISRKTDIYAMGCLLYEVIVGETPFIAENPMDMLMQHLNDDPYNVCEKVPDCPPALDALIERMLAKDPEDRPYDSLAVHTELGEIREATQRKEPALAETQIGEIKSGEMAHTPMEAKKKKKKKKKKRKSGPLHEQAWFLITCLCLLIAATGYFLLRSNSEEYYAEIFQDTEADSSERREMADEYLEVYAEEGKFIADAQRISDELHAELLERQISKAASGSRTLEPKLKNDCTKISRLENEAGLTFIHRSELNEAASDLKSNPLPILEEWYFLIQSAKAADISNWEKGEQQEHGWLIEVAQQHHDSLRQRLIGCPDARRFFNKRMKTAEESLAETPAASEMIWDYTSENFKSVESFADFAMYAARRFNGTVEPVPSIKPVE